MGYYPVKTQDGVVEMTPIEREMYRRLTGSRLKPRCQFPVGPYRIDFAFPEAKVAVEVDGSRWHRDKERDASRDRELESLGWKVIRITGSDTVLKDGNTILGPVADALRRRLPRRKVHCDACGRDLRPFHIPIEKCPDCGQPVA